MLFPAGATGGYPVQLVRHNLYVRLDIIVIHILFVYMCYLYYYL